MKILITIFLTCIITVDAMSCSVPTQGKKYNDMIKVIKFSSEFEDFNHMIIFPKVVEKHSIGHIKLRVFLKSEREPKLVFEPKLHKKDEELAAGFYLGSADYHISVSIWWNGVCPIIATKTIKYDESIEEIKEDIEAK